MLESLSACILARLGLFSDPFLIGSRDKDKVPYTEGLPVAVPIAKHET